jgi:hypothetical protein
MDTHRPAHFDDTNFQYYSARMACYLEVIDLGVWRVTRDGMKPPKNSEKPTTSEEKEMLEPRIACMNLLAWVFLIKFLIENC